MALTRELIDYVDRPGADLSTLPASSLMEDIVYVPETMSAMNALKLMRQRRLHMVRGGGRARARQRAFLWTLSEPPCRWWWWTSTAARPAS